MSARRQPDASAAIRSAALQAVIAATAARLERSAVTARAIALQHGASRAACNIATRVGLRRAEEALH